MILHVGFVYLSIFVSQHIPVVLQLELTTLPELQKEHSCKHTQEDELHMMCVRLKKIIPPHIQIKSPHLKYFYPQLRVMRLTHVSYM